MKNEAKRILKEVKDFETYCFMNIEDSKEAKHLAHELIQKIEEQETKLMEEKRKIDDLINDLRHADSKLYNYYLSIRMEEK